MRRSREENSREQVPGRRAAISKGKEVPVGHIAQQKMTFLMGLFVPNLDRKRRVVIHYPAPFSIHSYSSRKLLFSA